MNEINFQYRPENLFYSNLLNTKLSIKLIIYFFKSVFIKTNVSSAGLQILRIPWQQARTTTGLASIVGGQPEEETLQILLFLFLLRPRSSSTTTGPRPRLNPARPTSSCRPVSAWLVSASFRSIRSRLPSSGESGMKTSTIT